MQGQNLSIILSLIQILHLEGTAQGTSGVVIHFPEPELHVKDPFDQAVQSPAEDEQNVEFRKNVNSLSTIEDFAKFFEFDLPQNDPVPPQSFSVNLRTGAARPLIAADIVNNSPSPVMLEQANCILENTTVALDLPDDPGVTYFPTCVRVQRCGGCCYISHHSCQPTQTETIQVKVIRATEQMDRNRRRRRRRQTRFDVIEVEQHLGCDCSCKLRLENCDPTLHRHNEFQCACMCHNKEDEVKCIDSRHHYWNNDICQCLCRHEPVCSTGQILDHDTCRCV